MIKLHKFRARYLRTADLDFKEMNMRVLTLQKCFLGETEPREI